MLPLFYHELFDKARLRLIRFTLQVECEIASHVRLGQTLDHLLAAQVVPLIDRLLKEILKHRRIQLSIEAQLNLFCRLDLVMLDAELFVELRIVGLRQVQVRLFEWNLQLRVIPCL